MTTDTSAGHVSLRHRTEHFVDRYLLPAGMQITAFLSIAFLLSPIGWMISTSLKRDSDVFVRPPQWIPPEPTLDAYERMITPVIGNMLFNSVTVAVLATLASTLIGSLTAYALSRFTIPGKSWIMIFFLAAMSFPIPLLMMSMYLILLDLGLLNTRFALVIGHTVITLPVTVWLMKNFLDQVPREIDEAAYVEGASFFRIILIVFRLSLPALVAAGLFVFVTSWNELFFGLSFVSSPDLRTVPVGISQSFLQEFDTDWPGLMALAVIVSLPMMIIFLALQRLFIRGMMAGAVKG